MFFMVLEYKNLPSLVQASRALVWWTLSGSTLEWPSQWSSPA